MVANTPPADSTPGGKLARGTAQRAMVIAAAAALVGVGVGVGITIAVNRGSSPSSSPGAAGYQWMVGGAQAPAWPLVTRLS